MTKLKMSCINFTKLLTFAVIIIFLLLFTTKAELLYVTNGASITITGYYDSSGGYVTVIIPDNVNGFPVTSIAAGAFDQAFYLLAVTIPDSVTTIGNQAFMSCQSLTNVTIGNGVTSIGSAAFEHDFGITSIAIPDSITNIGPDAFFDCGLTNVFIGAGLTTIGDRAFQYNPLVGVYFKGNAPNSVGSNIFNRTTVYCSQGTTGWDSTFSGSDVVFLGPPSTAPTITVQPQDVLVLSSTLVSGHL